MYSKADEEQIAQSVQPRPRDVLADVYALRRRITLGVYAAIMFHLPVYYLAGCTLPQIALVAVAGSIIAGVSIYVAFSQIIRLRKRTSYSELLLIRLSDATSAREAAEEALLILEGLLETHASFIAMESGGKMDTVSMQRITEDEAAWVLETHAAKLETALSSRYPADVLSGDGHRAVFVPIVALKHSIGVLYVTNTGPHNLLDRSLLDDIGGALGLTLDNLRQKEQLLQKEARLRSVITGAPIVLFSVNNAGIVVFHQGQAMAQVGIEPESLIGRSVTDIYANYPAILQSFRRAFAGDEVVSMVTIEANGNRVIFEYRLAPEKDEHGRVTGVIGVATDVTQRKLAADALREGERFLSTLVANLPGFVIRLEGDPLAIKYVSDGVREITGFSASELTGQPIAVLAERLHPEDRALMGEVVRRARESGETIEYEFRFTNKSGEERWFWQQGQVVTDEDGQPVAVEMFTMDITERRQAEETIRRLAYHDSLTGLPNRALFEDRLRMALAQARRQGEMLGVLFLDVDSFKLVNDTLGHSAGDKLLQSVADDLSALVRECDTVARVGGDEFTLLLPSIERAEDVTDVAQRILECLRQPRLIAGQEFRATASIGITTFPADGDDGETLLRNADTAMYRAKDQGRDNYQLYTASMNQLVMDRLSFEQSLRQALMREELKVFYQPIIDVPSGRIVAAEALVRWFHPSRGIIMPDEFIPLAEETGIILDIGEVVLREACRQMMEWRSRDIEIGRVTVNVSARQLQQEDFVSRVSRILEETGVPPKLVQLEITEGAVLKNVEHAIAMLKELREMGMGLALDDFGTGYSSLTYLKRFPVDAVKIDRSFVRDLDHDANDATIVSTVIAMAANLGLRVIAEGVETPQQLEFLRARRCAEYQGYLFSKPLPPEEFAELVRGVSLVNVANGAKARGGKALPAA